MGEQVTQGPDGHSKNADFDTGGDRCHWGIQSRNVP